MILPQDLMTFSCHQWMFGCFWIEFQRRQPPRRLDRECDISGDEYVRLLKEEDTEGVQEQCRPSFVPIQTQICSMVVRHGTNMVCSGMRTVINSYHWL